MKYSEEIILIGNGPSVLDGELGSVIDGFGTVVRLNNFQTKGFEASTGQRTDIWIMNAGSCILPREISCFKEVVGCSPLFDRNSDLCSNYIDPLTIETVRSEFAQFDKKKFPSTGLFALAWLLKKRPRIFILGFDHFTRSRHHYFEEGGDRSPHNSEGEANFIQGWIKQGKIVRLADRVLQIPPSFVPHVSLTPKSETNKPMMKPLYISYYTHGNGYELEIPELIQSFELFGLEHHISRVRPFTTWQKGAQYKAKFVEQMMQKFPERPLVWVDADARIRQLPVLFDQLDCDVAAHYHNGHELLTGTLYFGPTSRAKELVKDWILENERFPKGHLGDQKNFQNLVERAEKLRFEHLPAPYTLIFDSMADQGPPVIEHMQASRRLKARKSALTPSVQWK